MRFKTIISIGIFILLSLISCNSQNVDEKTQGNIPTKTPENQIVEKQKFDSKIWQSRASWVDAPRNSLSPRRKMMGDLLINILRGSTKNEIESLLGTPDNLSWPAKEGGWNFSYFLDPEKGAGENKCLLIHFDENGYYQDYREYICG